MKLFNSTPVPARLLTNPELARGELGIGTLTAKATFRFDRRGRIELDTQNPFPLFDADRPHPVGLLPTDRPACRGDRFEVMLLGHAYAAHGRALESLRVALEVGDERREIQVVGDRHWVQRRGQAAYLTPPVPFERMPLSYERSFGGSCGVQLDEHTVMDVWDPVNRRGRGFDAQARAVALAATLGAPAGYPRLLADRRDAPNLEHPNALVVSPTDAPEPVGWAPAYPDIAVQHLGVLRRLAAHANSPLPPPQASAEDPDATFFRAHSDLVLSLPAPGAHVRLENLLPDVPVIEFALPTLRVVADYVIYGRTGERDLRPYALVLLPDEAAFYLCYGVPFTFEKGPASERAFRLRTASGWFTGSAVS